LAELLRTKQTSQKPISIIDLCTGSAPIALLLKHDLGQVANITGYDFSEKAIELAKENIGLTGLDISVQQADILERDFVPTAIRENGGRVDLIVSNPPYIRQAEYDQLPASVKEWEDPAALLGDIEGGGSGLLFYERIAELLPDLLTSSEQLEQRGWAGIPRVAVEIGHQQGVDVSSIFRQGGMRRTEVWQDQFGTDRMVLGWDS
jgi:release factor glutamine methyltransferase